MKALFSEYGRIVIFFIAAGALIFYLFYAGAGGFRQSMKENFDSYFIITAVSISMKIYITIHR